MVASYLDKRTQTSHINSCKSMPKFLRCGVPQEQFWDLFCFCYVHCYVKVMKAKFAKFRPLFSRKFDVSVCHEIYPARRGFSLALRLAFTKSFAW